MCVGIPLIDTALVALKNNIPGLATLASARSFLFLLYLLANWNDPRCDWPNLVVEHRVSGILGLIERGYSQTRHQKA